MIISEINKENGEEAESSDCHIPKVKNTAKIQFWGEVFFLIFFFVGLPLYSLSLFIPIEKPDFYLGAGFIVFIYAILAILLWYLVILKISNNTIQLIKTPHTFDITKPHHVIIFAHRDPQKNGQYPTLDYIDGADILLKKLLLDNPQKNYIIYDVEEKTTLIPALSNPNAKYIWIFGHGKRTSVSLIQDSLCYYELKTIKERKKFIGQYHCNSLFGKSFADYNQPENSDVTKWPRWAPFNRCSVQKKIEELGL
jgi:hypothetical protein